MIYVAFGKLKKLHTAMRDFEIYGAVGCKPVISGDSFLLLGMDYAPGDALGEAWIMIDYNKNKKNRTKIIVKK